MTGSVGDMHLPTAYFNPFLNTGAGTGLTVIQSCLWSARVTRQFAVDWQGRARPLHSQQFAGAQTKAKAPPKTHSITRKRCTPPQTSHQAIYEPPSLTNFMGRPYIPLSGCLRTRMKNLHSVSTPFHTHVQQPSQNSHPHRFALSLSTND